MAEAPRFLMLTCQIGAEQALKGELARSRPDWVTAYARPGFVTLKLPDEHGLSPGLRLDWVFAQSCQLSLGRAAGDDPDALARSVWDLLGDRPCQRIHVWQRPVSRGEDDEVEPALAPEAVQARQAIVRHCPRPNFPVRIASIENYLPQHCRYLSARIET